MTLQEFQAQQADLACRDCGHRKLGTEYNPNNNSHLAICLYCRSKRPLMATLLYLKTTKKKHRKEYPPDQGLYDVWERFGNVCTVCSLPAAFLLKLNIGLSRHHTAEYAKTGHAGPIVPVCNACKAFVDARQREAQRWYQRFQDVNESTPSGRPALPIDGVSPDSMSPEGQDSVALVEGLSGNDAHR